MKRVWDHSAERQTKLVALLSLADRADEFGVCWPGYNDTARRSRIGRRRAIDMMQELVDAGEIWMKGAETSTGRQTSNRYFVLCGLTLGEIRDILITHPQLRVDAQDVDAIVEQIEARRARRLSRLSATHRRQIEHAQMMREGGEGVDSNTLPIEGGEGVDSNTGGCSQQHPQGVDSNTPEGVDSNTRTQRGTLTLPSIESKERGPGTKTDNAAISDIAVVWEAALEELKLQMPRETFLTWLQGTSAGWRRDSVSLGSSSGAGTAEADQVPPTIVVTVANGFAQDWLANRLDGKVRRVLAGLLDREVEVEYVVRSAGEKEGAVRDRQAAP